MKITKKIQIYGRHSNNMDGILLINKEKGITSRDLVNQVSKKLSIKKVGHAGTLDPLATGLMIIGVGKGTKILDLLTLDKKEYIATVKMGIETDTLDITGTITNKLDKFDVQKENIEKALHYFNRTYLQEVPKYSAVKINGKRLYSYARNNESIELPKREVTIYEIELLDCNILKNEFKFRTLVSKGTYIRSLIKDIGEYLNIPCSMKELIRTKSGKFNLENSVDINNINNFINIQDALDYDVVKVINLELLNKIKNGNVISINNDNEVITLVDNNNKCLAIYKKIENNNYKSFKVF